MKRLSKKCKWCGDPEPQHWPYQCFKNPKASMKRIKTITKSDHAHKRTRTAWYRKYLPNALGYYVCYLCGKWMLPIETTLDHVIPRSRAPHLMHDLENLKPCCWKCNGEKGSKVLDSEHNQDYDMNVTNNKRGSE